MNWDTIEGKWTQFKGKVRAKWGKLTDDDVDRIAGKSEKLVGLLQERYGWTKERAHEEFVNRLAEYEAEMRTTTR